MTTQPHLQIQAATLAELETIRYGNRPAARAMAGHWLLDPRERITLSQAAKELGYTPAALFFWNLPESWAVTDGHGKDGRRFLKFTREDVFAVALAGAEAHRHYERGSTTGRRVNAYTTFMRLAGRERELPVPVWSRGARGPRVAALARGQAVPA